MTTPMHPACTPLVWQLNQLPGVTTIGSACGFGKAPYRVFFWVNTDKIGVFLLANALRQTPGWEIRMEILESSCRFVLEGPAMQEDSDHYPAAEELRKSIKNQKAEADAILG